MLEIDPPEKPSRISTNGSFATYEFVKAAQCVSIKYPEVFDDEDDDDDDAGEDVERTPLRRRSSIPADEVVLETVTMKELFCGTRYTESSAPASFIELRRKTHARRATRMVTTSNMVAHCEKERGMVQEHIDLIQAVIGKKKREREQQPKKFGVKQYKCQSDQRSISRFFCFFAIQYSDTVYCETARSNSLCCNSSFRRKSICTVAV